MNKRMETLTYLDTCIGHGTSMITMTIGTNADALGKAITRLKNEYSVSSNIKSSV